MEWFEISQDIGGVWIQRKSGGVPYQTPSLGEARHEAKRLANATGKTVRIIRMRRVEFDTIGPDVTSANGVSDENT